MSRGSANRLRDIDDDHPRLWELTVVTNKQSTIHESASYPRSIKLIKEEHNMAMFARPTTLRQSCLKASSTRIVSARLTSTFAASASIPASRLPQTLTTPQTPRWPESCPIPLAQGTFRNQSRVAAFHASAPRAILPAGPRKLQFQGSKDYKANPLLRENHWRRSVIVAKTSPRIVLVLMSLSSKRTGSCAHPRRNPWKLPLDI